MTTRWFDEAGSPNTDQVIEAVRGHLASGGIGQVVVATSSGQTALRFAEALPRDAADLVAVTHHVGFRGGDQSDLDPQCATDLLAAGVGLLTTSHALSGINRSISGKFSGTSGVEIIAHTLRLFGQGMKVCVEIAVMAADAGLIPTDRDVICVGGSGKGADTAVVLRAAHANNFFDLRIRETLCRPVGRNAE